MVMARLKANAVCAEGNAEPVGVIKTRASSPFTKNGRKVGKNPFIRNAITQAISPAKSACITCSFLIFPSINQRTTSPAYKIHIKKVAKNSIAALSI